MKTPKDNIFQLISSMSAAEKRYFKRHYSSDKNMLTDLFDFINSMDEYKEDVVRQKFADSKLAKNLKVYKVQLFDLLLKSLTSYHSKKSIRSKIRIGLEEAEILFAKQLDDLGHSRLNKVKKLCRTHELYEEMIPVLVMESQHRSLEKMSHAGNQLSIVMNKLGAAVEHTRRYYWMQSQLIELAQRFGPVSPKVLSESDQQHLSELYHRVKNTDTSDYSDSEKMCHASLHSYLLAALGREEASLEMKMSMIRKTQSDPSIAQFHKNCYLLTYYDFLLFCLHTKRYQLVENEIPQLEAFFEQHPVMHRNQLLLYYIKVRLLFEQKAYDQLTKDKLVKEIETYVKKRHADNDLNAIYIYLYLGVAFLKQNKARQSHFCFLQASGGSSFTEVHHLRLILEMMGHFENGDFFVIRNWIAGVQRKAGQYDDASFYLAVAKLFDQMIKCEEEYLGGAVTEFCRSLDSFREDPLLNLLDRFEFLNWLKEFDEEAACPESEVFLAKQD